MKKDKRLSEYLELLGNRDVSNIKMFYKSNSAPDYDLEVALKPTEALRKAVSRVAPRFSEDDITNEN